MTTLVAVLLTGILLAATASGDETGPSDGQAQLGVPVSWINAPGSTDTYYMAQRTRDDRLMLTPNEAFFPKRGLTASGTGTVPDIVNLNGGRSFATIEKWDDGDVAEWGLFFEKRGTVDVRVWMSESDSRSRYSLHLGETRPLTASSAIANNSSDERPSLFAKTSFVISEPGMQTLKLICEQATGSETFHWMEVSGTAAKHASVLRKRWRPAAAHTKFSSSKSPKNVRLWVMELDAVPGDLGFYSPITTPFGYYGPTWNANGSVGSSFNFSLWSFGRGKPEPPVEQLAHLLAIGNRDAAFGGFRHEGTGVKVRDWEPLAGRQGQRQTLALRVEPGPKYDTYFSYFYAADKKRWRLFAAGNKYNRGKPIKSLWVGSFVEVPGAPPVQRTGPYERTMRYRGWVMDADGTWHVLDQMKNGNVDRETGLTHTARGNTDEGWFYLQTGGWTFRKAPKASQYVLADEPQPPRPEYLSDEHIAILKSVPSQITASVVQRTAKGVKGSFRIRNLGTEASVTIYCGSKEGLTFAERWETSQTIAEPMEGDNPFTIETTLTDEPIHVRMLLQNSEGQFWTHETQRANHTKPDQ